MGKKVLIQIIKGTYGYRKDGKGTVDPKTPGDPPFEVDEKEAKRLIELKVAKKAEAPKKAETPKGDSDNS